MPLLTRHIVLAVSVGLFVSSPVLAAMPEDLARVENEMSAQKEKAKQLETKETITAAELDGLRKKLITATDELQYKQNEQEQIELQLGSLEKETALRAAVLQESQIRLAGLTSALVQLSREPPEYFVLHETSPDDHIHRAILLRSLLPRLKDETNKIAVEIESFERLQNETTSQKKLLISARQNLEWQKKNLDELVMARQGYLSKTKEEKEALQRQLDQLSNEARDLRQLMERVTNPSWGKSLEKGKEIKTPDLKPGLRKPVSGKIIRNFGEKDEFGVTSEGVTFLAPFGSPVVAPQSGRVVFAGPFKGYGKIVILQHAGGFHSFLSGFSRIDAETGQSIEAGEPLGILPARGEGKAEIYFEWRKANAPTNPTVSDTKSP